MRILKLALSLTLVLLISCKKKNGTIDDTLASKKAVAYNANSVVCGVKDPFKNIIWLKEFYSTLANSPELNAIVVYTYEGKEVVELQSALFSSIYYHQYYCDGSRLSFTSAALLDDYLAKRKELTILFGTKIR